MLFNSLQFLIFFPLVTTLYFLCAHRWRWLLLLAASCWFYMAFIPVYILILVVTILIDYFAAIFIENAHGRARRAGLVVSIASTCLVLFFFKYFDFFAANLTAGAQMLGSPWTLSPLHLILPIGLSFHTFQSLSYVIEVYRGRQRAERHFGIYSLYVMFYPQLVAGPIERPQNLLHQFREKHEFRYRQVRDGLRLMLWGLFKKVVVADRLSIYVDTVYRHIGQHTGPTILLATVLFAFQIYCDFSGYSDIALGAAKTMGFSLMRNFAMPYFSRSISEFWRRWHISLSTWFRDYLYVPLGGSRVSPPRWYANLMITFVVSGLWHGANWTYIIWGALNGMYLVTSIMTQRPRAALVATLGLTRWPRAHALLQIASTFGLTCAAWVFFRAANLHDAATAYSRILTNRGPVFTADAKQLIYGLCGVAAVVAIDYWTRGAQFDEALSGKSTLVRWTLYVALILSFFAAGVFDASQFIYFQF